MTTRFFKCTLYVETPLGTFPVFKVSNDAAIVNYTDDEVTEFEVDENNLIESLERIKVFVEYLEDNNYIKYEFDKLVFVFGQQQGD